MAGIKTYIFAIAVVSLTVIGILDVVTNFEENTCYMTYMFQQPEYLQIPLPRKVRQEFPNYGLYAYGEGNYARMLSSLQFTGIPVLYIPGNAGSYKQVRSLASVAFRRGNDKEKHYVFNFFAVDLNEEFTALYGQHIWDQTEFVRLVIKKIFALYKNSDNKPRTIVLAGHSMGGLVARGVFTLPDFEASQVSHIYMQATPNQAPVVVMDSMLAKYYETVNQYWIENGNKSLGHITLVSTGGGEYDVQVRGGLTPLDGIVDEDHGISTSSTHMPLSWVRADHRCIVWCKQVVMAHIRALFDIVDEKINQISDDVAYRMSVFRHHFLHHPGSIGHVTTWPKEIKLDNEIELTEMSGKLFKWSQKEVSEMTYLSIPVFQYDNMDHVSIVANIRADSWICVCEIKQGEKHCASCMDISSTGNLIPPLFSNKKAVHIDLEEESMARVTHVIIVVPPSEKPIEVLGEVYSQDKKHLSNSVPGLMEILMSMPESLTKGTTVLDLGTNSSYYRLKLFNLNSILKVYSAYLETSRCRETLGSDHAGSVLRFHVPWSNEDTYRYFKYGKGGNLTMRVQFVPPTPVLSPEMMDFQFGGPGQTYDSVELEIYLDPTCSYKLRVTASFKQILGQFVRFYGLLMPVYCVTFLLMCFVHQLRTLTKVGYCPSILASTWQIKPYLVVPFALLTQAVLQTKLVQKQLQGFGLILSPDIVLLEKQGIIFKGAQLCLYLLAGGLVTFHACVISLVAQFNSRLFGLMLGWCPHAFSRLLDFLMVMGTILAVGLAVTACGTLGILITYILCFIQMLRLSYQSRQAVAGDPKSRYNFYFAIFMIWMWLLLLNGPPLIIWAKAVQSTEEMYFLSQDPSRLPGAVAALSFLFFLLCDTPFVSRSAFKILSLLVHVACTQMLVFGGVMLYRISYVVMATMVSVAVVQLLGEMRGKMTARPKTE